MGQLTLPVLKTCIRANAGNEHFAVKKTGAIKGFQVSSGDLPRAVSSSSIGTP